MDKNYYLYLIGFIVFLIVLKISTKLFKLLLFLAIITVREARFNNSEVLISVSPYGEEFEDKIGDIINEKYLEITDNN